MILLQVAIWIRYHEVRFATPRWLSGRAFASHAEIGVRSPVSTNVSRLNSYTVKRSWISEMTIINWYPLSLWTLTAQCPGVLKIVQNLNSFMMTTPYVLKILELDIRTKVRFARSRSFGRNAKNRGSICYFASFGKP